MITLSREDKISNYEELLYHKRKKLINLSNEIQSLERKLSKLKSTEEGLKGSFSQAANSLRG